MSELWCQEIQRTTYFPAGPYQALARRRGKKIATTAIARRLLTRAYHLLRDVQARHDRQGAR
ncbi:MAG: hypothetical protein JO362_08175 [Streptomycetaceae bacterium]|nr:hypothetical protein [Streptomycetaceae bacterium]